MPTGTSPIGSVLVLHLIYMSSYRQSSQSAVSRPQTTVYEVYVIQAEDDAEEGVSEPYCESRVQVGLSGSTIARLPNGEVETREFWKSISRLLDHLRQVDIRGHPPRGSVIPDRMLWSARAAQLLAGSLGASNSTQQYVIHRSITDFSKAVQYGTPLTSKCRKGGIGRPSYSVFIISRGPKSTSELNAPVADTHPVVHAAEEDWCIAEDVVAAVNGIAGARIPINPSASQMETFCRAMDVFAKWTLRCERFTHTQWQTILTATEERDPEAAVMQAQSTQKWFDKLEEECPALKRSSFLLEAYAGQTVYDDHNRMRDAMYD